MGFSVSSILQNVGLNLFSLPRRLPALSELMLSTIRFLATCKLSVQIVFGASIVTWIAVTVAAPLD